MTVIRILLRIFGTLIGGVLLLIAAAFFVVAMDDAGNFVVVWQSNIQDGSVLGIFCQRYNASGVAQGAEFQINTYTASNQGIPSVSAW